MNYKWQDQGNALIHAAQTYLWSGIGKEALEYLHSRGLTDETIRRFHLGYWPQWTEYTLADWGLEGDGTFWLHFLRMAAKSSKHCVIPA